MPNTPNLNVPIAQPSDAVDRAHHNTDFSDADTAFGTHKTASPVDHPNGSVTNAKLATGAATGSALGPDVVRTNALADIAATIRTKGQTIPTSGAGLEQAFAGAIGFLSAFSRDTGAFLQLVINGALKILPNGQTDLAGTFRSTTQTVPTSGQGVELAYFLGQGYLTAINRDDGTFRPLHINYAAWTFPDRGVYVGDMPLDPGANNLGVQARIVALAAGASAKRLLNFVPVSGTSTFLNPPQGNLVNTAVSLAGVPASAVAVSVTAWYQNGVNTTMALQLSSDAGGADRIIAAALPGSQTGCIVNGTIGSTGAVIYYALSNGTPSSPTLTFLVHGYFEPA